MSIEVEHVSKTYGDHRALRDVTLTVPDGELTALLGPSGSGKTTLLRVIAGLELPDAHDETAIRFAERDVARQRVADRRVGFVFQHYALFRHLSVFENIAFGLRVRPRRTRPAESAIRAKVNDLLGLIQLDGLGHRYPEELSGGQRQRVALARALAVEPQVLLLDEPFGALDAKVRQELRRWLRRLHDTIHVTSLFVTHDQDEALEVADRVVVMNEGQIEQEGTPDEVFHQPANAFVTDFLGHVNLFHGRVEHGQAVFGSLRVESPVEDAREGQPARLFVRPHELELQRVPVEDGAILARVVHVHSAGPQVRVELVNESGEEFQAELTHERFAEMPLRRGDHAYVSLRDHRVFVEDYTI